MSDSAAVKAAPQDAGKVTSLLIDWSQGDSSARERLTPIIYEDLVRLARARLKREYRECTLQPTALVHWSRPMHAS
jgi:ECF sigma factor